MGWSWKEISPSATSACAAFASATGLGTAAAIAASSGTPRSRCDGFCAASSRQTRRFCMSAIGTCSSEWSSLMHSTEYEEGCLSTIDMPSCFSTGVMPCQKLGSSRYSSTTSRPWKFSPPCRTWLIRKHHVGKSTRKCG